MPDFSFKKGERISSKLTISSLFKSGKYLTSFPFRMVYLESEIGLYPAQVVISVPKRIFKKAVDRNLLKRRIREAYRLNKPLFYSRLIGLNMGLKLVIQYQHSQILDYQSIESGLKKALEQVLHKLEKH